MTEFNAFYLNNLETLDIWGKFKDLGKHCPPPLFSPFVKDEQHQFSYNISSFIQYSTKMSLSNIKANRMANYTASQKHESTLLQKYVCTERIFNSQSFMLNEIFLEKLLQKLVVQIFMLLLAPFTLKLVNYSRHSESLNIRKNSEIDDIFL